MTDFTAEPDAMLRSLLVVSLVLASGSALAQSANCTNVPRAMPVSTDVLAPLAPELSSVNSQLGTPAGVLTQAYDAAMSADAVILRLRIEGCRSVASTLPAMSPSNPNDPATYKPQTQWDNTPWRFNMTQNGRRMTADEFDAWMKAKGIRVAKGAPKPAVDPAVGPPATTVTDPAAPLATPTPPTH